MPVHPAINRPKTARTPPGLGRRLGLLATDNPTATEGMIRQIGHCLRVLPIGLLGLLPGFTFNIVQMFKGGGFQWLMLLIAVLLAIPSLANRQGWLAKLPPYVQVRMLAGLAALIGFCLPFLGSSAFAEGLGVPFEADAGGLGILFAAILIRLPAALLAFTFAQTLGLMISFPGVLFATLFAAQMITVAIVAYTQAGAEYFAQQDRSDAEDNAVRANRLLAEFEQSGSGWFWETDRQGNISYISPKLSRALGVGDRGLIGKPLSTLSSRAGEVVADTPAGQRTLSFHLSSRTAFSDLQIAASIGGEARWWSITGRPILNEFGQFRGFIGSGSDLTEQRKSEAEVSRLARFDPLTGLANRAETGRLLIEAIGTRAGLTRPCALMMLDLDRFKQVNDTLGHPAGDALLKQVAQRLLRAVGTTGQVGRLGGDEFKVVLPGAHDRSLLAGIAKTIIETVSAPYRINDTKVTIGVSIGLALAPDDGSTSEELVRNADLALYAAKEAGRGVHRFYQAGMHSAAEERRELEQDLRRAIAEGEFHLVYQPIVSISTESIIGFESLIRWQHPTRGPISPAEFIPMAEETGLIEPIGEWILRQACADAAAWPVTARVAVNISAIQFANPRLPTLVSQVLAQSRLDPDRLELEITETVFVVGDESTDRQFAALKALGVRLALDDFGTGYSSLGYLQRAPFDKIKIDQSFVRGATLGDNRNAAIITAIVSLANTLKIETTVEGVETQDEILLVKRLGCSHIQGFVFGRPMPGKDLLARMRGSAPAAETTGHQTSRTARFRVLRAAELIAANRTQSVRIRNVSTGGAAIEPCSHLSPGMRVKLNISDGPSIEGEIRWISRTRAGMKFDHPINLAELNAPLAKAV